MFKIADKASCVIPNLCCDRVVIVLCAKYISLNIKELSCTVHVFYIQHTKNSLCKCEAKVHDVSLGSLWFGHILVQNTGKVTLLITSEDHY